jgi:hypothetical protein
MVFGWGKKKDVSHDNMFTPSEPENLEISTSDIPKILKDINSLREKTLIAEIKSFRNKIDSDRKNLLSIANQLKNDNLKTDDLDNHIKIILNRAISDVSSTIQKEFQTSFAEINSINDVLEFEKLSSKAIKKVVDVLRKHRTGIALFAKKYARKFKEDLEILDSYLQEIKNLTSNYKSNQEFLSIINENLEKITITKNTIIDQEKHVDELSIRLKEELSKKDELLKKESKIISSPSYKSYVETKSKLDQLQEEEKKLRYSLDEHFVKISRPLNKYVHISSLEKPLKILNEKMIDSPYNVLSEENNSDIVTILNSVESAIISGAVSVKDKEKSKEQLSMLKSILPNLIQEKTNFYKKKSNLSDNLEKFDYQEFSTCKIGLKKSEDEIHDIGSKQTMLQKQIEENNKLISNTFSKLEINLKSASSVSYKIISD